MSDVNISKFRAQVVRDGSNPATPGFVVSEGQNPVDPAGSGQNHLPVTIAAASTGLAITESQVLGGAGTVAQYIRGDGSLADFPATTGGGSSVSYYLNGSVSQGTIGGVAYLELNRMPIFGAGTDFTRNSDGYIASFITDAGDPNKLEIPAGNWNLETYFSASSGGGNPTFYVELYKYNGTTFTLIASNSGSPELIAFGTNLNPYFSTLAVPQTTLALTDRLALRYYVTTSGRTITLHTENNHLCQVITTFTTGLTALNGLTSQVQFFAVGTSGTDFNIASSVDTHTFNLPTASGSNRGALSSADWSTFNGKENAITAGTTAQYFRGDKTFQTLNTSVVPEGTNLYYTEARVNANTNVAANTAARHNAVTLGTANGLSLSTQVLSLGLASAGVTGALSGTDWSTFNSKQNALTLTTTGTSGAATLVGSTLNIPQYQAAGTYVTAVTASSPLASSGGTTPNITIQQASGSQNGFLSSTDWTTFNNKQNALTNPVTGTGTTNYLSKFTGASTIGNSQIFDNGTNVGINQAIPTRTLDILGASGIGTVLKLQGASGTTTYLQLAYNGATNAQSGYIGYDSSSNMTLFTNDTERMRITSGGNVLIGGTSSTNSVANLQVFGSTQVSTNNGQIRINDSSTTSKTLSIGVDGANNLAFLQSFQDGVAYRNLILNGLGGNVGIGTTTPNSRLHVAGDFRTVLTSGVGGDTLIAAISGVSNGYIINVDTSNNITHTWNTGANAAALRITPGGNVLIGTTTDNGARLQVSGSATIGGNLTISSGNNLNVVTGDIHFQSNAGYGILSQNGNRLVSIQNGAFGVSGAATFSSSVTTTFLRVSDSAGQIGEINSSNANGGYIVWQTSGTTIADLGTAQQIFGAGGNDTFGINGRGARAIAFGTNNTERMRITSGGNVGIGTSSPSALLHLGSNGSAAQLWLQRTDGYNPVKLIGGTLSDGNGFKITMNNIDALTITSGGQIQYPNTGNNSSFVSYSSNQDRGITNFYQAQNFPSSNAYTRVFDITSCGDATGGGAIRFLTSAPNSAPSSSMLINTNGNVLIGTTTDVGARLHVNGAVRTGAPSGGSAVDWRLGTARGGTITPNAIVRVEIGGVLVDLDARYV